MGWLPTSGPSMAAGDQKPHTRVTKPRGGKEPGAGSPAGSGEPGAGVGWEVREVRKDLVLCGQALNLPHPSQPRVALLSHTGGAV